MNIMDEEGQEERQAVDEEEEDFAIGLCRSVKLLQQAKLLPLQECKKGLRICYGIMNAETTPH